MSFFMVSQRRNDADVLGLQAQCLQRRIMLRPSENRFQTALKPD
ncbi:MULTISPECIES: hypothetical protein [unclassified Neisseria]|nr:MULTISPECIES: hypothetical protein [unclassified Neisseria]MDO1509636.1 hypothetical protein [Neisseria sp. MVDL19-042950]MDO1515592.1 hypothetical protein [Neisseria sp. MVDL18-041461]MDO1564017.1 hypothetical protein [Neisseria sp. MVDL20-010259]